MQGKPKEVSGMRERRRLERQPDEAMIAGVAAGAADYLGIDRTLMRLLFVGIGIVTGPVAIVAYLIAALVMPKADEAPGLTSARSGMSDLVGRGRQFLDEGRRVIDQNRGGRASAGADVPESADLYGTPAPPSTGPESRP
jgi:phage shock protein C